MFVFRAVKVEAGSDVVVLGCSKTFFSLPVNFLHFAAISLMLYVIRPNKSSCIFLNALICLILHIYNYTYIKYTYLFIYAVFFFLKR